VTWRIRPATPTDATYIDHLMHRFSAEVGFLTRTAILEHLEHGHYSLLEISGDPVAYTLTTGGIRKPVRILQHAVDEELWRQGWGLKLIEAAALKATRCPMPGLTLTCRDGLPANAFWQSSGARLIDIRPGGRERRKMVLHWGFPLEVILDAASEIAGSPHLDDSNLHQSSYRTPRPPLLPLRLGSSITPRENGPHPPNPPNPQDHRPIKTARIHFPHVFRRVSPQPADSRSRLYTSSRPPLRLDQSATGSGG